METIGYFSIHDVLCRIDRRLKPRATLRLAHQVARAVLAALDRERERREHTGGDEDSPEPSTAAGFFACCHFEPYIP